MSGFLAHCIWLTLVLCHASVDAPDSDINDLVPKATLQQQDSLDNVRADWRFEDRWKWVR